MHSFTNKQIQSRVCCVYFVTEATLLQVGLSVPYLVSSLLRSKASLFFTAWPLLMVPSLSTASLFPLHTSSLLQHTTSQHSFLFFWKTLLFFTTTLWVQNGFTDMQNLYCAHQKLPSTLLLCALHNKLRLTFLFRSSFSLILSSSRHFCSYAFGFCETKLSGTRFRDFLR